MIFVTGEWRRRYCHQLVGNYSGAALLHHSIPTCSCRHHGLHRSSRKGAQNDFQQMEVWAKSLLTKFILLFLPDQSVIPHDFWPVWAHDFKGKHQQLWLVSLQPWICKKQTRGIAAQATYPNFKSCKDIRIHLRWAKCIILPTHDIPCKKSLIFAPERGWTQRYESLHDPTANSWQVSVFCRKVRWKRLEVGQELHPNNMGKKEIIPSQMAWTPVWQWQWPTCVEEKPF